MHDLNDLQVWFYKQKVLNVFCLFQNFDFDIFFNRHMGNIWRSDLWWGKTLCQIHHSDVTAHEQMLALIILAPANKTFDSSWDSLQDPIFSSTGAI